MKQPPLQLRKPRNIRLVYDTETGKVLHTHMFMVLPRAKAPTEEQVSTEAIALAHRYTQHPTERMKVFEVPTDQYEDGASYKINLKDKALEKISSRPKFSLPKR